MTVMPLPNRIVGALALQPMTVQQLATCLSANHWSVRSAIAAMTNRGEVCCRRMDRRQDLHELTKSAGG